MLQTQANIPLPTDIKQHFLNIHAASGSTTPFNQYLKDNLFFVTMTAHPTLLKDRSKDAAFVLRLIGSWYAKFCRKAFPNNLARRRSIQPLVYAFVDFDGTRHIRSTGDSLSELPHVHALILIQPDGQMFKEHLLDASFNKKHPLDIELTPFDPDRKNEYGRDALEQLIHYSSKGARSLQGHSQGPDLWSVLPP